MTIRIDDEYLDFSEDGIEMVRRVKTATTLETAGDFSYSFELPYTTKNIRLLKLGGNRVDNIIYHPIPCIIDSEGIPIYIGSLRVEGITNVISASFFSSNTEWFQMLGDKVYDADMSQHKEPRQAITPSSSLVASWHDDEWIVYPLMDLGKLQSWFRPALDTQDFMAMVYLRDVFRGVFQANGLKVTGELFDDSLFNMLVVGSNSNDGATEYMSRLSVFAGKSSSQSISTTPTKVTFTNLSFPYYNDRFGSYADSRYTAQVSLGLGVEVMLNLSSSEDWTVDIKRNGSTVSLYTVTGSSAQIRYQLPGDEPTRSATVLSGQYLEVFVSIASGSTNITDGWVRHDVKILSDVYPQFLLGAMTQTDLVTSVFTMFNVVADYIPSSKTVVCNLMRNLPVKEDQDLSEYLSEYEQDFIEPVQDFGQRNIFTHNDSPTDEAEEYSRQNPIPFGAGVIEPDNGFLVGDNTITTAFTAPFSYFNNIFQANMALLGVTTMEADDNVIGIIHATDDSPNTEFETDEAHGLKQNDFVLIRSTSNGQYVGFSRVASVASDTLFTISLMPFAGDVTGEVSRATRTINKRDNVFIAVNVPSMPVSDFSNADQIRYASTDYSNIAYGYLLKANLNLPIDKYKETAAFDNPSIAGYSQIGLLDKYYQVTRSMVNNPVKVLARMHLPEGVFNQFDFSRPVRLKTEDFNYRFFCQSIEGYKGSEFSCVMNLIKI